MAVEAFDGDRGAQARAVGDVQRPDVAQDMVAADDRLGDELGTQAVALEVAHPYLAHGAAQQEAVDDRAEAVLAVDRGGQIVRARRLDQRRGHPLVEGHRDRACAQSMPCGVLRRRAVPARGVLDLPDQHDREVAVDRAGRPDRVPAPAGVAPVAAEVGADPPAEVAQAEHGLETGVLFAVARSPMSKPPTVRHASR
jgi:hypothetical protein